MLEREGFEIEGVTIAMLLLPVLILILVFLGLGGSISGVSTELEEFLSRLVLLAVVVLIVFILGNR